MKSFKVRSKSRLYEQTISNRGKKPTNYNEASCSSLHNAWISVELNSLAILFQALPKQCIVLFEDIDSAGLHNRRTDSPLSPESSREITGREEDRSKDSDQVNNPPNGISLSAFLNIIDGVGSHEGRILIMTTNYIDELDPALTRPGRIDKHVPFRHADKEAVRELFLSFYTTPIDSGIPDAKSTNYLTVAPISSSLTANDIHKFAGQFADLVPSEKFTAADIQNYLFKYKNAPELAVAGVINGMVDIKNR